MSMTELAKGVCQFTVIEEISRKTNKPFKALRLNFNGYELRNFLFVNDDQLFIIRQKCQEPKKAM